MMRWSQRVSCGIALSACVTVQAQAAQHSGEYKADTHKIKVVKQADGSEMLRLAGLDFGRIPAVPPKATTAQEQRLGSWLAAVAEPRLMRALASLPETSRDEGQNLSQAVDPAMVRSWAEIMDPSLALSWNSFAQVNGFAAALLQRPEEGAKALKAGGDNSRPTSGVAPWVNTAVSTTWRNVVSEGSKRALSGQQALQEWLMLPTPEPKSNPWLSNLGNYRY